MDKLPGDQKGVLIYRFDLRQESFFRNRERAKARLPLLDFHTREGVIVDQPLRLDEAYLAVDLQEITRRRIRSYERMKIANGDAKGPARNNLDF